MKGRIIVISGPSGVGKSTLIRSVRKNIKNLSYSVSHTTRSSRPKEKDGVDYFFVDKPAFQEMIDKDDFVEWAQVYDDYYGTSFKAIKDKVEAGFDMVLDIDIQGAKNIKEKIAESLLIFILPPSKSILENRLRTRATDNANAIEKRINHAAKELASSKWYDYLVVNDDLEKAKKELEAIIIADRCANKRALPDIEKRLQI